MHRRSVLISFATWPALAPTPSAAAESSASAPPSAPVDTLRPAPRALQFPADFGAHPQTTTEWWYLTGELQADARVWGFQVTFFRVATRLTATSPPPTSAPPSRFAPTQLLLAHSALTDLAAGRLRHDQRLARTGFGVAQARGDDTAVELRDWSLRRSALPPTSTTSTSTTTATSTAALSRYHARIASDSAGFALELDCDTTQPVLLQGDAGLSRKGPGLRDSSRYYSQPQLATRGTLTLDGKRIAVHGRAWLDHEWSDGYIPAGAVGWDWIGMNLADGSALTAFRMRRADGSSLYAGGSFRAAGQPARNFAADSVRFIPGRIWESSATRARYPVEWTVETPAGRWRVRALLDNQELDSRASSGAIYWEGLSELIDENGARVGRGYLEMTGYVTALRF